MFCTLYLHDQNGHMVSPEALLAQRRCSDFPVPIKVYARMAACREDVWLTQSLTVKSFSPDRQVLLRN